MINKETFRAAWKDYLQEEQKLAREYLASNRGEHPLGREYVPGDQVVLQTCLDRFTSFTDLVWKFMHATKPTITVGAWDLTDALPTTPEYRQFYRGYYGVVAWLHPIQSQFIAYIRANPRTDYEQIAVLVRKIEMTWFNKRHHRPGGDIFGTKKCSPFDVARMGNYLTSLNFMANSKVVFVKGPSPFDEADYCHNCG